MGVPARGRLEPTVCGFRSVCRGLAPRGVGRRPRASGHVARCREVAEREIRGLVGPAPRSAGRVVRSIALRSCKRFGVALVGVLLALARRLVAGLGFHVAGAGNSLAVGVRRRRGARAPSSTHRRSRRLLRRRWPVRAPSCAGRARREALAVRQPRERVPVRPMRAAPAPRRAASVPVSSRRRAQRPISRDLRCVLHSQPVVRVRPPTAPARRPPAHAHQQVVRARRPTAPARRPAAPALRTAPSPAKLWRPHAPRPSRRLASPPSHSPSRFPSTSTVSSSHIRRTRNGRPWTARSMTSLPRARARSRASRNARTVAASM